MSYDSRPDTQEHIDRVRWLLTIVTDNLYERGLQHDQSKLSGIEKEAFDLITPRLQNSVYGSEEYKANLAEIRPAIQEHYKRNSHHAEHYENGIAGMSLLDLVELICDWKAAGERGRHTDNGSMLKSLDINIERFKIEPQLASILKNTIIEMGWS